MERQIMQFYPASPHFILLRSKYSLGQTILKLPQSLSSLNVKEQVCPYKRTAEIIVLCVLIFTFLDIECELHCSERCIMVLRKQIKHFHR